MSRTKRMIASLLALALLIPQFTSLNTFASQSATQLSDQITGEMTVSIVFDDCNLIEDVTSRDVTVVVKDGQDVVHDVVLNKEELDLVDDSYSIKKITDGDILQAYQVTFVDMPAKNTYSLAFYGEGHVDFIIPNVDLSDYSQSIVVSTSDNTFTYGDINGDKRIDNSDLDILKAELADDTAGTSADLNGDGIVNIVDLAVLTDAMNDQIMGAPDYSSLMTNTVRLSSFADLIDTSELSETVTVVGNVDEIFNPNTSVGVEFYPIEQTDEDGIIIDSDEVVINFGLVEPTAMTTLEIETPTTYGTINDGMVVVTVEETDGSETELKYAFGNYEIPENDDTEMVVTYSLMSSFDDDGVETITEVPEISFLKTYSYDEVSAIADVVEETNVITIDLGTRVVVKKISVVVEVADNDLGYVVIQNVTFVEDIVPENPYGSDGIVNNLAAISGDKQVNLKWDSAENVAGYIVKYGTSPGKYTESAKTTTNSMNVTLSDNFVKYYFAVQSFYDEWTGPLSNEVMGMGQPTVKPSAPDTISVTPADEALFISWVTANNAETHNVYIKHEDETTYRQIANQTTSNSVSVGSLINDEIYDIKITGVNWLGEGSAGYAEGIPEKINLEGPNFSTYKQVPTSNIINVTMSAPSNYNSSLYPNGFSAWFTCDDDYSTYWQYSNFYASSVFNYTFEEAVDMNYVVWVPNVTDDSYATTIAGYCVTVWYEGDNLNGSGTVIKSGNYATYTPRVELYTAENGVKYAVIPFEKQEKIQKIAVGVYIENGGARPATLAEIKFYEYDGVSEMIDDLFANDIRTEVKSTVTQADFDAIEAEMLKFEDHVLRESILQAELDLAKSLFTSDTSDDLIGYVKEDFVSINYSGDNGAKLSNISPLGIVGYARYDILMYADIPEGETLTIYPSQTFASNASFKGTGIVLKNGKNIINVADLTNVSGAIEGGPFYYVYTGDKADEIKLHIYKEIGTFQGIDYVTEPITIPTLELRNYNLQSDKTKVMQLITEYVEFFDEFMAADADVIDTNQNINYNQTVNPINSTEISLRGVLISQPASGVYSAIGGASATVEAKAEKLYNNALAWEEINYVTNRVYGDVIVDGISTREGRQNVRYMRMSGSAFMYAAGNHIGTMFGSAGTTVSGTPTSVTGTGQNNLFGWGIAHEIGHNLDRIGILEVTNNIYSQLVVNYTGAGNQAITSSRIPFTDAFAKVSATGYGASSNVFVELGKYWQLQLAYADEADMLAFYADIFTAYRLGTYTGSNKFEVIASLTAGYDLTDFFAAWGTTLSTEAKNAISHLPKEERAVWYLNDSSRVYKLNAGTGISGNQSFNVTATAEDSKVTITNDYEITSDLQGFIVYKDGKSIAFTTTNSYVDTVSSTNNKVLSYSMQAVDKLGNIVSDVIDADQLRISYENLVDGSAYTVSEVSGGVKVTFNNSTSISGIRVLNAPTSGAITAEINCADEDGNAINYATVLDTDFSKNDTDEDGKYISYFLKPGADADDTRIGTYDALELTIYGVSISDDLAIISYVGDSVEFADYVMGILGHDYDTGDGILYAGDVIVVGTYIGDPYFNEITINGEFVLSTLTDEGYTISTTERPFSGDTYMFATVPEGGVVSTIYDGLFIFKPNLQAEADFQDADMTSCTHETLFPNRLQAVMTRNDSSGNGRETSNTLWEYTATYETMPTIMLESDFDNAGTDDELVGPEQEFEDENDDEVVDTEDENDDEVADTEDENDDVVADTEDENDDVVADTEDENDDVVADTEDENDDVVVDTEDENDDVVDETEENNDDEVNTEEQGDEETEESETYSLYSDDFIGPIQQ